MSRAKEIQEKLALNAKLQVALNANSSKVLSWLDNDERKEDTDAKSIKEDGQAYTIKDLEDSKKMFFKLPVVQIGSGLNMGTDDDMDGNDVNNDIHTIGEFIESNKKVSSLAKKKKRSDHLNERNNIYRVAKDDTKAMVALKNKIRSGKREEFRRNGAENMVKTKINKGRGPEPRNATSKGSSDDESSEDEDFGNRKVVHSKKSVNLLFNGKKKGRK